MVINGSYNNFGLNEREVQTIVDIFKEYPEVKQVNIFGSRAKGNYRPGSDIDLAILNEGIDGKTIRRIKSELDDSTLPLTVDIVYLPEIGNSDLINHIARVGVRFYEHK